MANNGMWESIISWYREDAEINNWLDDTEKNVLIKEDLDELEIWKALTTYQGFDPKRIIKIMIKNKKSYMQTSQVLPVTKEFEIRGVKKTFDFTDKESMSKDVKFIIFVFATRGSTWSKFTKKSFSELDIVMDWMASKYGFDKTINQPNSSLDPDTITIPRIVACFPMVIAKFYHDDVAKCMISFDDAGWAKAVQVSKALLCTFTNSLIPRSWCKTGTSPHAPFFLTHVLVDSIIHRKTQNFTSLSAIYTYYAAAYNTPAVPEDARKKFMIHIGISNPAENGFALGIMDSVNNAEALLRSERSNDPDLIKVISDL